MIYIVEVENAADTYNRLNVSPPLLEGPYVALDLEQTEEQERDIFDYNTQQRHSGKATSIVYIPENTFDGGQAFVEEPAEGLDGGISDLKFLKDVFYLK